MYKKKLIDDSIVADTGLAAALEAKRIAEKYNKDFLDCDNLVAMLGVGKNNVRDLMHTAILLQMI